MTDNATLTEQIKDLRKSVQNNIDAFINVKPLKDRWKQFFEDRLQLVHDIMVISDILRMNRKLPFVIPTENGQIAVWLENNTITIEYSDKCYNRKNGYTIAMNTHCTDVIFYKPVTENGYKTNSEFFSLSFHSWEGLYKSSDYENYYSSWNHKSVADKLDLFEEANTTFDVLSRYFDMFIEQFKEYVEEKLKAVNS